MISVQELGFCGCPDENRAKQVAHAGNKGFPADIVYRDFDMLQHFAVVIGAEESTAQRGVRHRFLLFQELFCSWLR